MSDQKKEETKKGPLGKLKDKIDDSEEQLAILSTFVRLGILVWSGGILTLAYIKLPPALGIQEVAGSNFYTCQCLYLSFSYIWGSDSKEKW